MQEQHHYDANGFGFISMFQILLVGHREIESGFALRIRSRAAEKIGGIMETTAARPGTEPPEPTEESRCKVIPFERVG